MSPFLAVVLVLVLSSTCYAAGRLHGQLSYRIGYRFGYRQGYFDGDRGAWNRRRRDAQAAIASALSRPAAAPVTAPATRATTPFAGTAVPAAVAARPVSGGGSPRATATAQLGGLVGRTGTTYTGASAASAGGRQTGMLVRRQG
ncbi:MULTISPECIES: hypothetical protein [Micromonospora]|uniref:Uncharacterized protein n=1 Tax=Micromonospora solifontis TaxID=2487138 RepID=A0ABX9WLE4_9ACTN|nr:MULTISPECIES: hypothetical protein [Micromonospora]NES14334.1 hypothetical protein [Micromonospora sp. PPF5-17B]NES35058.1 hypothetical protein [Micromonospora solifontis]RNM01328.1 hypothetical protein EFE23_02580 [Micromonospora solifontis]